MGALTLPQPWLCSLWGAQLQPSTTPSQRHKHLPFPHLSAPLPSHPPFQICFLNGKGQNTTAAFPLSSSCVSSPIPFPKHSTGAQTPTWSSGRVPSFIYRNCSFLWLCQVPVVLRAWAAPLLHLCLVKSCPAAFQNTPLDFGCFARTGPWLLPCFSLEF